MNTIVSARIFNSAKLKNLKVVENAILNNISSSMAKFTKIYEKDSSNIEIYNDVMEPVFDLLINGMNISLLSIGDKFSGKNHLICGDSTKDEEGIFAIFLKKLFNRVIEKKHLIEVEMFQMSDEIIVDLLEEGVHKDMEILDSVEFGAYIKDIKKVKLDNYNQGIKIFNGAMKNRKSLMATVIKIQIENIYQEEMLPTRSQLIIVMMGITKPLIDMPVGVKIRETDDLNQTVFAFSQLVASLANQQFPDRIVDYQKSKLTRLLEEVLGGNCKTSAIIHLKDDSDPRLNTTLFHLAENISKVVNYPVVNTSLVRKLLILYRSRALAFLKSGRILEPYHDFSTSDLIRENEELNQEVQNLKYRLELSRSNKTAVPYNNNSLTNKLLLTQEEKHEIEKMMITLQMEKNQLLEEREDRMCSHRNEIYKLRHQIELLQRQEETISLELRQERELRLQSERRIEDTLPRIVDSSARANNILKLKDDQNDYNKLFEETQHLKNEIEKQRNNYDNEIYEFQKKISDSGMLLNKTKIALREEQKKNAKLTASLIIIESEKNYFEPEYHRLQNKLKMANEDFRERLNKYVKDIANYVDSKSEMNVRNLRPVVDSMLADMHTAHKARERQLSQAAHNMKDRLDQYRANFDRILNAYKDVYEQVEEKGALIDLETPSSLLSIHQSQISPSRLQSIKKQKHNIDKNRLADYSESSTYESLKDLNLMLADMSVIHERERAQLITKNALLDGEVKALHDYINRQHKNATKMNFNQ